MNEKRDFKGIWIPKEIWTDSNLSWTEKLVFVEINSLDNEKGCFASNEYFASFFNLSKDRISRVISALKKKGYVDVFIEYKDGSKQIKNRIIKSKLTYSYFHQHPIGENTYPYRRKHQYPIGENAKDNNTSINNTFNNTSNIEALSSFSENSDVLETENDLKKTRGARKFSRDDFYESLVWHGAEKKDAQDWVEYRAKKKGSFTQRALDNFYEEVKLTNGKLDVRMAVKLCADKSWVGFNHEWQIPLKYLKRDEPKNTLKSIL